MKLDHKDYINILLFIVVVILMFVIVVKIQGEGTQCTLNPLEYGANQLRNQNNKEIMCQCNLISDGISPTLYFDHNNSYFERPFSGELTPQFPELNTTKLNITIAEELII